jgi:hypothetical protein
MSHLMNVHQVATGSSEFIFWKLHGTFSMLTVAGLNELPKGAESHYAMSHLFEHVRS